jgi:hypothetical protein
VGDAYLPWAAPHYLGTDKLGRDMLTRLIYGARNTVGIALPRRRWPLSWVDPWHLGGAGGGLAGPVLSRFVDALMAIPALIFSLLLLTIFGTSVLTLILVIAAVDATRVYRLARSVAQGIVVMDYIEAARLRGEGMWRLIRREILPNAMAPLVAEFGLRFCFVFLAISALSFLGLGIKPPTADWGSMVRENATLITFGDITPLLPAGAIALADGGGELRGRLAVAPRQRVEGVGPWKNRASDHEGPADRRPIRRRLAPDRQGRGPDASPGEVLGLIGESGAGKSTLGLAAMGFARDGCRISGGTIALTASTCARRPRRRAGACAASASPMSRSRRRRASTRRTS